jgi:UDP-glucose 4-epimerase
LNYAEETYSSLTIQGSLENYVHTTYADISKIHEEIGWKPQIDFEEGVRRVCAPYMQDD